MRKFFVLFLRFRIAVYIVRKIPSVIVILKELISIILARRNVVYFDEEGIRRKCLRCFSTRKLSHRRVFIKSTIPRWREFPLSVPLGSEGGWGRATKRHLHLDDCRRIELQRKLIRRRVTEDVATSRPAVARLRSSRFGRRGRERLLFKPGSRDPGIPARFIEFTEA